MTPGRKLIEADIELAAVAWAAANGWFARKLRWIGRRNAPDRVFGKGGRVVFIEFKRPRAKPRIGQVKEADRMRAAGMEVHCVDSMEMFLYVMQHERRRNVF